MNTRFALCALLWPALGLAQTVPQQAAAAAAAGLPVPAIDYQPMAPVGALVQDRDDWKAANAIVGQHPRGHADIVKWERAQQAPRPAPPQEAPR